MRQYKFSPIHKELNGLAQLMGDVLGKDMQELSKPLRELYPAVNVRETNKSYLLDLVVPGIEKEAINIRLDQGTLIISYEEKKKILEENKEKQLRKEFSLPSFKRSFTLPKTANFEDIKANYVNGILSLDIAKKEIEAPKKISVL
jgi:HSP20 family protein